MATITNMIKINDVLPDNCLLTIFTFLSFSDNKHKREICKLWNKLLMQKYVCSKFKLIFTSKNIKYLEKCMKLFPVSDVKIYSAANTTTVIMEKCGHLPMLERPDEAVGHYLKFLKSIK